MTTDTGLPERDDDLPDQAESEFDPKDANDTVSQSPAQMDVDAAQLLNQALEQTRMALCITDPHLPDSPIVLCNQAFVELTGYAREEIVGHNCRFLQGEGTDPKDVARIREIIESEEVRVVELLNYRKDGTPFWNSLHIGPIYDSEGRLTHYYGSQWDVTDLRAERDRADFEARVNDELRHRTRNLFAVVNSIMRLSARGESDVRRLVRDVTGRVEALSRAHEVSIARTGTRNTDLHGLVAEILRPYRSPGSGRIGIAGPALDLAPEIVTPLGLTLHELATNALKHGALREPDGRVSVSWTIEEARLSLAWEETGGAAPDASAERGIGEGSGILEGVLTMAGGALEADWRPEGLRVSVTLTLEP